MGATSADVKITTPTKRKTGLKSDKATKHIKVNPRKITTITSKFHITYRHLNIIKYWYSPIK